MKSCSGIVAAALCAISACKGEGGGGSGSASSSPPPPPKPKPAPVKLVRCAPASMVPMPAADDNDLQGGLLGDDAPDMQGGFGFGSSGFGPGGGGTGWGTIGTGRYGTIGHGAGTIGSYGGGMRGRSAHEPQVRIGQPNAVGDLDKAIIRRYIKRNLAKITYCYEKQLLAKPTLGGTLTTQFFITPNGDVASSKASGVDPAVASCVAGVIKAIEFPKPKGGGGVQVNYPFTFRPAEGDAGAPPPSTTGAPAPPPPRVPAWTPYANERAQVDAEVTGAIALATQTMVQARLDGIDRCFGELDGGSLRALIVVGIDGSVGAVRAGGLGDAKAETCVEQALGAIKVAAPDHLPVEIACDLARGAEQPWRITTSRYDVIAVHKDAIEHGGQKTPLTEMVGGFDADQDVVVVADPDATGDGIAVATALANGPVATMIAIRDGDGAPLYAGVAPGERPLMAPARGPRLDVTLHADDVEICIPGAGPAHVAPLAELDRLVAEVGAACKQASCSDGAAFDVRELSDARTLATMIARLRTIGITRVVIGGPVEDCKP